MAAKTLTRQQQRDRRAKLMLGVLGVVLLAVVGLQLPKLLGAHKGAAVAPATPTTAGNAAPSPTPVPTGSSSVSLASVVAAPRTSAQLTEFSRFARKDPFKALVVATTVAATGASAPAGPAPASAGRTPPARSRQPQRTAPSAPPRVAPRATTPAPAVTFSTRTPTTPAQPTGPMVLAAVLRLNGVRKVIPAGVAFPTAKPVFKLVGVAQKAMWIMLVGGTFANGQQTLKIELGHPAKLVNENANLDYVIQLVRMTTVPKPAAPPTATTTSPSTTATSSTPTTTTTQSTPGSQGG
jgi:hypothetical protein